MKHYSILFIVVLGMAPKLLAQVPQIEKDALIALYNATDGDNWTDNTNWLSEEPVDTWFGIAVSGERVTGIQLYGNNLTGNIPEEIDDLSKLTLLGFYDNQLSGIIPSELSNLVDLEHLDLDGNQLSGSVPPSFQNFNKLKQLFLGSNQLTGSIPLEIGEMTSLEYLDLGINKLTGSIPVELGLLTNLVYLSMGNNNFNGPLPDELATLSKLEILYLSWAGLTGQIPSSLGQLTVLKHLDLGGNNFSGEIPIEITGILSLERLYLNNNDLTGNIPSEFGSLTSLKSLHLDHNNISGAIPGELGSLSELDDIRLNNNQLEGSVPAELGSLVKMRILNINHNQLSGEVPTSFSSLVNLESVRIESNQLTGLPDLSANPSLSNFVISDNNLTFEDIEANIGISGIVYSPQNNIPGPEMIFRDLGQPLQISFQVGGSANEYQWVKDDVDIIGEISDNLIIANTTLQDEGTYYLRITNTLVPDLTLLTEDIVVEIGAILTGINPLDNREVEIYPVPAQERLFINMDDPFNGTLLIRVIDVSGKEWKRKKVQKTDRPTQLDVSQLRDGIYTVILQMEEKVFVKKIVKQ